MKMTEKLLPKWETFLDPAYYNCWAVRLEGDLSFNATFHLVNGDEAKALVEFLNRRSPLPAVEGGWREIESAPKDGTRFLTFDDHYGVRMGRAFIRADHDDWLSYVDCNGNSSKGGIRATHWQPLPTPPHPSRRRESR